MKKKRDGNVQQNRDNCTYQLVLGPGSLIPLPVTELGSASVPQSTPLTNLIMTLNCEASVEGPSHNAF